MQFSSSIKVAQVATGRRCRSAIICGSISNSGSIHHHPSYGLFQSSFLVQQFPRRSNVGLFGSRSAAAATGRPTSALLLSSTLGQSRQQQHVRSVSSSSSSLDATVKLDTTNPSSTATKSASSAAAAASFTERVNSKWYTPTSTKGAILASSLLSLAIGYNIGRHHNNNDDQTPPSHEKEEEQNKRVLPSGLPRSCCSCEESGSTHHHVHHEHNNNEGVSHPKQQQLTDKQKSLPTKLQSIIGKDNVIDGQSMNSTNAMYLKGARLGSGTALCVVTPTSLQDAVTCLQHVVDADCVIVPQGANTGLTGGSVPRTSEEEEDQRPVVIMNMRKLDTIFPIDDGKRVVCLAGAGIGTLSKSVTTWFPDRESHSILGSIFLNPTTAAGVAFGSGGTQLRKGPAYTDRAMYVKVHKNKWDENVMEIVNTLGVEGIEDTDFPYDCGKAIEQLDIYQRDVKNGYQRAMGKSSNSVFGKAQAKDATYPQRVCNLTNGKKDEVSRYNADTSGLDCNRSEGKVLILATVHDTFPKPIQTKTFWLSFVDLPTALQFRKEVCLDNPQDLPISVEYMDRDAFDVIDRSGRIIGNLIKVIGIGSMMGQLWKLKLKIEALPFDGAPLLCDRMLHQLNNWVPPILSNRFMDAGRTMDHHIAMTIGDFGDNEMDRVLQRLQQFASKHGKEKILVNECHTEREVTGINAFRFVAAPAFRTWCVGEGVQGISVDYALPKCGGEAPPLLTTTSDTKKSQTKDQNNNTTTPPGGQAPAAAIPLKRMRYSHFGCNVVHEDIAYDLNVNVHDAKMGLKQTVEHDCGGKLPAEHGHGTEYVAPMKTQQRWMGMDPLNVMNPGVGGLSSSFRYGKKKD